MEEDPIVSEMNIYISTQLAPYLHIVQLPGNIEEMEGEMGSIKSRYKKTHKLLEMELPMDVHHPTYCCERAQELVIPMGYVKQQEELEHGGNGPRKLCAFKMIGSSQPIPPETQHFVALCHEDSLHLTPIESLITMRPTLDHLDEADAKRKSTTGRDPEPRIPSAGTSTSTSTQTGTAEQLKTVQVQFKKRETEEQLAARLSSFAHLQKQLASEPWINMTHFLPKSTESGTVSERLISPITDPIVLDNA